MDKGHTEDWKEVGCFGVAVRRRNEEEEGSLDLDLDRERVEKDWKSEKGRCNEGYLNKRFPEREEEVAQSNFLVAVDDGEKEMNIGNVEESWPVQIHA